jgi:hypothetical protein
MYWNCFNFRVFKHNIEMPPQEGSFKLVFESMGKIHDLLKLAPGDSASAQSFRLSPLLKTDLRLVQSDGQ